MRATAYWIALTITGVFWLASAVADDSADGNESMFDGHLRVSIGMSLDEVVAAYDVDCTDPVRPEEPRLEISRNTQIGSFVKVRATPDHIQQTTPQRTPDADSVTLFEGEVIDYGMSRWGSRELYDDYIAYFSSSGRLGSPLKELPGSFPGKDNFPALSEGEQRWFWYDESSVQLLCVEFLLFPGSEVDDGLVRVSLTGGWHYSTVAE